MYYYDNLTSTEPQSPDQLDQQLGLTRRASVQASISVIADDIPANVPVGEDTIYGKQ